MLIALGVVMLMVALIGYAVLRAAGHASDVEDRDRAKLAAELRAAGKRPALRVVA